MTFLGGCSWVNLSAAAWGLGSLTSSSISGSQTCWCFSAAVPNCARSSSDATGISSYTGKMATCFLMSRNKAAGCWKRLRKLFPFLARLGWVVVLRHQVLGALQNPPSLSVPEWVQCPFPGVTGRIMLSPPPKWGEMMTLCDHRTIAEGPFSLGHITDFRSFNIKHQSASSTST